MKYLTSKKWATLLCLSTFLLFACSDDGGDDKPSTTGTGGSGGGGGTTINKYNGSASYGDILDFEVNQTNSTYTAVNLTTNITESSSFSVLDAAVEIDSVLYDVFQGIYEIDEGTNGRSYAIEIADRLLAGNFPTGRAANDIFLALSDEQDYSSRTDEIEGDYFYVALEPGNQSTGQNEWGMFSIDDEGDLYGFYSYKAPEDTTITIPIDSAMAAPLGNTFYFELGLQNGDELTFTDENDVQVPGVVGYVYIGGESTAIMIDQGTGEGTIFAFKIDDSQTNGNENFNKYIGEYKYVDFYEGSTLDKGAGNFSVQAGHVFDRSLIGYVTDPSYDDYYAEVTSGISMTWTGYPGLYVSNNYDGNGSDLYQMFAGDFVMYFDYTSSGNFQGYGIGGRLD